VPRSTDDYDSPWKEALGRYLPQALALLLPRVHAEIDWSRPPVFLDKELQQVTPRAARGLLLVDKLARVWRLGGDEIWVLVHVEVQSQPDPAFAARMFGYYARIFERFSKPVASVAILADERARWRPARFEMALWGCDVRFRYPVIKLRDYRAKLADLEESQNPFATVILAHLRAQETRRDPAARAVAKLRLIRRLYEQGFGRAEVIELFRLIDWFLQLPDEGEDEVWRAVQAIQEEQHMPYVTSVERIGIRKGMERGRREGLLAGLELILELKFGEQGRLAYDDIRRVEDVAVLDAITARLHTATVLDDIRALYEGRNE